MGTHRRRVAGIVSDRWFMFRKVTFWVMIWTLTLIAYGMIGTAAYLYARQH
jgi:hypothetical protein